MYTTAAKFLCISMVIILYVRAKYSFWFIVDPGVAYTKQPNALSNRH